MMSCQSMAEFKLISAAQNTRAQVSCNQYVQSGPVAMDLKQSARPRPPSWQEPPSLLRPSLTVPGCLGLDNLSCMQGLEMVAALRLFVSRASGLVAQLSEPLQQLTQQLSPFQQLLADLLERQSEASSAATRVHEHRAAYTAAQVTLF